MGRGETYGIADNRIKKLFKNTELINKDIFVISDTIWLLYWIIIFIVNYRKFKSLSYSTTNCSLISITIIFAFVFFLNESI